MNHYALHVYNPGNSDTLYALVDAGLNSNSEQGVYSEIDEVIDLEVNGEISRVINSLLFGYTFDKYILDEKFKYVYDVEVVDENELEFVRYIIYFKTPQEVAYGI
jgi:hypothetical protein